MSFKPKRLPQYSETDIIQEIRRVVAEDFHGELPSQAQFLRVARVSLTTIRREFGSFAAAMREAGFTYKIDRRKHKPYQRKYTAEQVWDNLREVLSRANGYRFSSSFYRANGGLFKSRDAVKDILGLSWEAVMEKIGAKRREHVVIASPHAQRRKHLAKLTTDDLLKELDRVWQHTGRRPTRGEFKRISKSLDAEIYVRRFGSWSKAIESLCAAKGIPVPRVPGHRRYSDDELFDEIQRMWEQLGRQPFYGEMAEKGKISAPCYQRRFGSWIKAVHAFCKDRNSESALTPPPISEPFSVPQVSSELAEKEPPIAVPSAESNVVVVVHKTGRSVPKKLRWRVFERNNFTCQGCGRSRAKHGVVLHADHIKAWTNGGETVFENLQTLCEDCNLGKSNL